METINDNPGYQSAHAARLRNLLLHIDKTWLSGKRILEVGCGTGEPGQAFTELGCSVVSVDGCAEHIEELRRRFPDRTAFVADPETWDPTQFGEFDVVLFCGLFHPLSAPARVLAQLAQIAPTIYLETAVTDSNSAVRPLIPEAGSEGLVSGTGLLPSLEWLRKTFRELGFETRDISTGAEREGARRRAMILCTRAPASNDPAKAPCTLGELLGEAAPEIRIVDVGALWLGEASQPYGPLVRNAKARVIGFEPIEEECRALNSRFEGRNQLYLPYVIGDGSSRVFHRCNYPMTSSLYKPDLRWMDLFDNLAVYCQVESLHPVETHRLDDVKEIEEVDFLKLDVQGAEMDVLRGASRILHSVLAIQTEVEFVPIYENQPLFADVDQLLRSHGFMFYKFVNMEGRRLASFGNLGEGGQALWSDAVYLRPVSQWDRLAPENLLRLAQIMHELYGSFDYVARLLAMFDEKMGSNHLSGYMQMISSKIQRPHSLQS